MAVIGVGIDVCDIARFEESVRRTPAMLTKLFTEGERGLAPRSLAARFAAKEALAKALQAPVGMAWHDAEVVTEVSGRPLFVIRGTVLAVADGLGVRSVHLSLTHDSGIASAFVVLEG